MKWNRAPAARWPAAVKVLLAVCAFVTVSANAGFFAAALRGRELAQPASWGFALALLAGVFALQVLLVAAAWVLLPQRLWKAVLAVVLVVAAVAGYFVQQYGVVMDPGMLENALHTDAAESRELLTGSFALHLLLYALLPLALLWRTPMPAMPWRRGLAWRVAMPAVALLLVVASVLAVFQPFSALMRNERSLRYQLTPANVAWSLATVAQRRLASPRGARQAIGLDAVAGPVMGARGRPRVLLLVVGETARAANWGLNSTPEAPIRDTTPELSKLPVINFSDVTACGTSTEVSLPCMFAPVGRRDYDEARIRGQESLLHVLARAGVKVHWRDNQSGCKGVCAGLPGDEVATLNGAGLCNLGHCLDEGLISDLDGRLQALARAAGPGTQVWVLHMLGSHGPSYVRRYPPAFERFTPACKSDELRGCTRDEVANAYDNSLLYTDHVLATAVRTLAAHAGAVDSALLYVSDHGESLGEANLYLHGMPYPIAPDVQKKVPWVMWFSDGFAAELQLDVSCLRAKRAQPVAHDHLFHTVLGLADVHTTLHDGAWDLTTGCRPAPVALR
jgi:lipid A ethanolaminephosphotransferase